MLQCVWLKVHLVTYKRRVANVGKGLCIQPVYGVQVNASEATAVWLSMKLLDLTVVD